MQYVIKCYCCRRRGDLTDLSSLRCDDNYLRDDAMRCDAMMDDENVAPYYRVGFTL